MMPMVLTILCRLDIMKKSSYTLYELHGLISEHSDHQRVFRAHPKSSTINGKALLRRKKLIRRIVPSTLLSASNHNIAFCFSMLS